MLTSSHPLRTTQLWYVGRRKIPTREQLRQFGRALTRFSGQAYSFSTWFEAFDALEDYLDTLPDNRKKVVFIDEMPWIDRVHSNFVLALEGFWNGYAMKKTKYLFIY